MSKAAAAASLPPPPPEVAHLVDQLQRHHLAPDASLLSISAHSDLLQAREEVASERARYLEALPVEPGVGGVPDRFLGITSEYLYQVQQEQPAMTVDMVDYQRTLAREIEARLEAKCDALADLFAMDERDSSSISQISSARLPERVKLIIEEIEKEEALLLDDLASMDRKFAEHYNDDLKKTWLIKRCRTMNAKLSYLEHHLLRDTYTKETVPALHRIRKYLVEATKEASNSYTEAVSRLREYQGVDPHFDAIARQYHEIVKKLEGMQWTIHQVEMDLKPHHDHAGV
uniref:Uncharacterized protein n=1 Tax=Oryza meridionalis TaxID=40149 RepID=A0A0E0CDY9_9ORYZ